MFTYAELADIHFMYGRANGNTREAQRLYRATFPNRRCPAKSTFSEVHRRARETGCLTPPKLRIRDPPVRTVDLEEQVLQIVENDAGTSTRKIAAELGVSHVTVWKVLREQQLKPYHAQRVQALTETDYQPRLQFCHWFLERCITPNFHSTVLFTDEAKFSRDAILNYHNNHQWSDENPHAINNSRHQHQFSCNVWAGILGDYLIGPFFLPPILNGQVYRNFLEGDLPGLLEEIPLEVRNAMWFMHDGAPAHFSLIAREFLNETHHNRWIGRGGPIAWPARSPDCNPLDYFLWGHLKSLIYRNPIPNVQVLRTLIIQNFEVIRNTPRILKRARQSMINRCQACILVGGSHFEQLL